MAHIRTHEGWLYLAVILDLFTRRVIGWSLQARLCQKIRSRHLTGTKQFS
jgi:putative transposase